MKKLICEMCGSDNLIKANGLYVCQQCETKYTVEEARTLMTEVEGVSADISFDDNSLTIARQAMDREDFESAERYYDKVLQQNSNNIEATVLSAFCGAVLSLYYADYHICEQKFNILANAIQTIEDNYDTSPEDKKEVIERVEKHFTKFFDAYSTKQFAFSGSVQSYNKYVGVRTRFDRTKSVISLFNNVISKYTAVLTSVKEKYNLDYIDAILIKHKPIEPKKTHGCLTAIIITLSSLVVLSFLVWLVYSEMSNTFRSF
jgi:hypothetical protein